MAFLVEDGTKVVGASSYASVVDCDTYHIDNGNSSWANADNSAKEAALRKAARYLDGHYRLRLKGQRVDPAGQAMEWPRYDVQVGDFYMDPAVIPQRLKDAQCELAIRALVAPLADDGDMSIASEKVDIITTAYREGVLKGRIAYPVVDQLMSDFLSSVCSLDISRS